MSYSEQLAAVIAQIETVLKPEFDATVYATAMIESAEIGESYFEVRGLHTKTGNPHAFTI